MLTENGLEEATEGGTFVSATGGTFETAMPGTFHSATGGTFETVLGGTIKPLPSAFLIYSLKIRENIWQSHQNPLSLQRFSFRRPHENEKESIKHILYETQFPPLVADVRLPRCVWQIV